MLGIKEKVFSQKILLDGYLNNPLERWKDYFFLKKNGTIENEKLS